MLLCGFGIKTNIGKLDIVPNYSGYFDLEAKRKVEVNKNLTDCERKIEIAKIEWEQKIEENNQTILSA